MRIITCGWTLQGSFYNSLLFTPLSLVRVGGRCFQRVTGTCARKHTPTCGMLLVPAQRTVTDHQAFVFPGVSGLKPGEKLLSFLYPLPLLFRRSHLPCSNCLRAHRHHLVTRVPSPDVPIFFLVLPLSHLKSLPFFILSNEKWKFLHSSLL